MEENSNLELIVSQLQLLHILLNERLVGQVDRGIRHVARRRVTVATPSSPIKANCT